MGYFNYFVKCIIRNIAYKLCKPKVLLTVLLCIIILFFCFRNYGYCVEWTQDEINVCLDNMYLCLQNLRQIYSQLDTGGTVDSRLSDIDNSIIRVENALATISSNMGILISNSSLTVENLRQIYEDCETVQMELVQINTDLSILVSNSSELVENTNSISQKLDEIALFLKGEGENVRENFTILSRLSMENNKFIEGQLDKVVYFSYDSNYTYDVLLENTGTTDFTIVFGRTYSIPVLNGIYGSYSSCTLKPGEEYTFNVSKDLSANYICFLVQSQIAVDVRKTSSNALNNLNDSINDMNDSITNDNVDTDNLQFATDDTVNPTSEGFDTFFNTIYNAFCTTTSEPLTITLPFINETFTIQPNVVSNGMRKAGLGVIVTLINSFYYFSVCLFIYKDINKIIENLKSGNITSDCGNVKTEVL